MPRPQRFAQLPLELTNGNMRALAVKGEPIIVASINDVGNLGRWRESGRTNRTFIFEYSRADACHTIRIPHSIWHMDKNAVARELLDKKSMHEILVTVELPADQIAQIAKAVPAEPKPGPPALRLPRHLRHLPQYVGKPVTKDAKGHLCVDGKPVHDGPVKPLPQDQTSAVEAVKATSKALAPRKPKPTPPPVAGLTTLPPGGTQEHTTINPEPTPVVVAEAAAPPAHEPPAAAQAIEKKTDEAKPAPKAKEAPAAKKKAKPPVRPKPKKQSKK